MSSETEENTNCQSIDLMKNLKLMPTHFETFGPLRQLVKLIFQEQPALRPTSGSQEAQEVTGSAS
jgi:hypothetical protein